jgi:membrane associated rhomboid family serine protease
MRRVRLLHRHVPILGASFPVVPIALAALTLVLTLLTIMGARNGLQSLMAVVVLSPSAVLERFELWRIVSFAFVEPNALGLIFGMLVLLFFGRDLCNAWGPERFLVRVLALVALTGLVSCLIVRFVWVGAYDSFWLSVWPLGEAIILAWATQFPSSQVLVYFVMPVAGRRLVILTVAGTFVFAALEGFDRYLPHFVAQGLTLAWLHGLTPRGLWLRLRARTVRFRPRPTHLRPVERPSEPPRWLH